MRKTMKQQIIFVGLALFLILGQHSIEASNYTGCQANSTEFGQLCYHNPRLVHINKDYALKLHNDVRNAVALNLLSQYDSAAAMAALKWDDELADSACISARKCVRTRDSSRNTEKYPKAGQNIVYSEISQTDENLQLSALMCDAAYFHTGNMDAIKSYPVTPKIRFPEFAQIIYDQNNAVGCCMVRSNLMSDVIESRLICNYGNEVVPGKPVYEVGPAASKCKLKHATYEGLCA